MWRLQARELLLRVKARTLTAAQQFSTHRAQSAQDGRMPPPRRGTQPKPEPPPKDALPNLDNPAPRTWGQHFRIFLVCGFISFWFGVIMSVQLASSDVRALFKAFDVALSKKWSNRDKKELETVMDRVVRTTLANDTTKRRLIKNDFYIQKLFAMLDMVDRPYDTDTELKQKRAIRNQAATVLYGIVSLPEAQKLLVQHGYHVHLLDVATRPSTGLFVRKTLAQVFSTLAQQQMLRLDLLDAGVMSLLHAHQQNPLLKRQRNELALQHISETAMLYADVMRGIVDPREWALVEKYYQEYALIKDTWQNRFLREPLIQSGATMLAHTVVGGGVYGFIAGLRQKQPWRDVLRSSFRTSIVTGVVPLYIVVLGVEGWRYLKKDADTPEQNMPLYGGIAMISLTSAWYGVPFLDRWSPPWLGGHVLGFTSLLLYLLKTDRDILKSDNELHQQDVETFRKQLQDAAAKEAQEESPASTVVSPQNPQE